MQLVKLIDYSIRHDDPKSEFIYSVFSALNILDDIDLYNKEDITYCLEEALEFIVPKDLGLTDWN